MIVNQRLQGRAHWQFVQARIQYVAGERVEFCTGRIAQTQRFVPFRAFGKDLRNIGEGFGIVDKGRLTVDTAFGGERRLAAGEGETALQP